jgi:DNA invertase Pin-like site-specific DNA recombinase
MTIYGYACVSTAGSQTLDAQRAALRAAGTARLFEDASGDNTDRKGLTEVLASLHEGDVLIVSRLDTLAPSTQDLLSVLAAIAEKGAGVKSITDTWADTTTEHARLLLAGFGRLAKFEREVRRARAYEGLARAKARGARLGRKPKLTPDQVGEAIARCEAGEALAKIGRSYGVSYWTISRLWTSRRRAWTVANLLPPLT